MSQFVGQDSGELACIDANNQRQAEREDEFISRRAEQTAPEPCGCVHIGIHVDLGRHRCPNGHGNAFHKGIQKRVALSCECASSLIAIHASEQRSHECKECEDGDNERHEVEEEQKDDFAGWGCASERIDTELDVPDNEQTGTDDHENIGDDHGDHHGCDEKHAETIVAGQLDIVDLTIQTVEDFRLQFLSCRLPSLRLKRDVQQAWSRWSRCRIRWLLRTRWSGLSPCSWA